MRSNIPTRLVYLMIAAILLNILILPGFSAADASGETEEPAIEFNYKVKAALMMETDTGKIIFEKDSQTKLYPASVTKIMTVLLAMEALKEGKYILMTRW